NAALSAELRLRESRTRCGRECRRSGDVLGRGFVHPAVLLPGETARRGERCDEGSGIPCCRGERAPYLGGRRTQLRIEIDGLHEVACHQRLQSNRTRA